MADNFRNMHSNEITVPNPSSVKDLLVDSNILANVKRRLQDEAEDTANVCRVTQHLRGIKHIAAGRHARGKQAYAHWRVDSAKRKRDLNRHNRAVRLVNLLKVLERKHPHLEFSKSDRFDPEKFVMLQLENSSKDYMTSTR